MSTKLLLDHSSQIVTEVGWQGLLQLGLATSENTWLRLGFSQKSISVAYVGSPKGRQTRMFKYETLIGEEARIIKPWIIKSLELPKSREKFSRIL